MPAVLLGLSRLDALDLDAEQSHQTESSERLNGALALGTHGCAAEFYAFMG